MALVIAPKARTDLGDIWRYSFDRWGKAQADAYLDRVRQMMSVIAADPRRGIACDTIKAGYRRIQAGSHVIFFRMRSEDVHIVRILHQKMDFDRHL